jgi:hypothetical protein
MAGQKETNIAQAITGLRAHTSYLVITINREEKYTKPKKRFTY